MEEMIDFIANGYTLVDILVVILLIVAIVRCIECFCKWCAKYLKSYYKQKRGVEEKNNIIETHSQEIKEINEKIDRMILAVDNHFNLLSEKIERTDRKLDSIDTAGKQRDRALLRDRIIGGVRYFSQNVDSNGNVHISFSDHENMSDLFEEYFECGGNGTVKQLYENEFVKWIVS